MIAYGGLLMSSLLLLLVATDYLLDIAYEVLHIAFKVLTRSVCRARSAVLVAFLMLFL